MLLYKKVKSDWDRSLGSQRMKEIKLTKGSKTKQNGKTVVTTKTKSTTVTNSANAATSDIEDDD